MATKRHASDSSKVEILPQAPYFDVDAFVKMQQHNVETMLEANRIFVDTAQAIARCQSDLMKDYVEQVTRAFAELSVRGEPGAIATKEGAAVQALFEKTAGHVRDIADLLSKSNADAIQLVNGRVRSLMDETRAAGQKALESAAAAE
jgi:phasin family protein